MQTTLPLRPFPGQPWYLGPALASVGPVRRSCSLLHPLLLLCRTDKLTSLLIPLGFRALGFSVLTKGLYHMYTGEFSLLAAIWLPRLRLPLLVALPWLPCATVPSGASPNGFFSLHFSPYAACRDGEARMRRLLGGWRAGGSWRRPTPPARDGPCTHLTHFCKHVV